MPYRVIYLFFFQILIASERLELTGTYSLSKQPRRRERNQKSDLQKKVTVVLLHFFFGFPRRGGTPGEEIQMLAHLNMQEVTQRPSSPLPPSWEKGTFRHSEVGGCPPKKVQWYCRQPSCKGYCFICFDLAVLLPFCLDIGKQRFIIYGTTCLYAHILCMYFVCLYIQIDGYVFVFIGSQHGKVYNLRFPFFWYFIFFLRFFLLLDYYLHFSFFPSFHFLSKPSVFFFFFQYSTINIKLVFLLLPTRLIFTDSEKKKRREAFHYFCFVLFILLCCLVFVYVLCVCVLLL